MYKIPAITLFLGKNQIFMPECHSTNDVLLKLCQQKANLAEGSLVVTSNQTAGRGQRGNVWEAEPGRNLTFSFLLKPQFLPVIKQFYLNVFISLAIRDYLTRQTDRKVQIKWPNDILLDSKKMCGVLIENQIVGQRLSNSIVGIGMNVNQQHFSIPMATSLSRVTAVEYDLPDVLSELLVHLEKRYLELRSGGSESLLSEYLQHLYLLHQPNIFQSQGESFSGMITGIDDIGRLKIETDKGARIFDIKEISYN